MRNVMSWTAVLLSAAIVLAWVSSPAQSRGQEIGLIGQRMSDVIAMVGVPDAATAGRSSSTLTWQTQGHSFDVVFHDDVAILVRGDAALGVAPRPPAHGPYLGEWVHQLVTDFGSPQSVEEGEGVGLSLHYADGTDVWVAHGHVLGVTEPR